MIQFRTFDEAQPWCLSNAQGPCSVIVHSDPYRWMLDGKDDSCLVRIYPNNFYLKDIKQKFTIFKPGDKVRIVNDKKCAEALNMDDVEYTVELIELNNPHAYVDDCRLSTCFHSRVHPQVLKMIGYEHNRFSGFWFDPIVAERIKE